MRISSDERGGAQEHPQDGPPDDQATRQFTRNDFDPASGNPAGSQPDSGTSPDANATQKFTREPVRPAPPTEPEESEEPGEPEPLPEKVRRGKKRPKRRRFRLRWLIAAVILAALLVPAGTWTAVWYTARQDQRPASDAIIVLGASQYDGRPSAIFEARLNHAAELYNEGVAPAIVTVGGNLPGDNYTEAEAGRNWLVEQGVPAESVVAVAEGSDTLQSLEAVALTFDEREWSSAVLVSDPWHALRSKIIASDTGIDPATSPVRTGPAVYTRETQMRYITRETASLLYYWTFGESAGVKIEAA